MSKTVKSEVISRRRALSFLGLAGLSLAVPTTVLTVSDAEAQAPAAQPAAPRSIHLECQQDDIESGDADQ